MSEFDPTDFEKPTTPFIPFNINGERHVMHWYNTSAFYHLPYYCEYDNILFKPDDVDEGQGIIIWRQHLDNFDDVLSMLDDNDFPLIFTPEPSDFDRDMYDKYTAEQAQKIGAFLTEWADGTPKE